MEKQGAEYDAKTQILNRKPNLSKSERQGFQARSGLKSLQGRPCETPGRQLVRKSRVRPPPGGGRPSPGGDPSADLGQMTQDPSQNKRPNDRVEEELPAIGPPEDGEQPIEDHSADQIAPEMFFAPPAAGAAQPT
jgi:hypothetical protein